MPEYTITGSKDGNWVIYREHVTAEHLTETLREARNDGMTELGFERED